MTENRPYKPKGHFIFLAFLLPVLLIYWPTQNAGFTTDFLGWAYNYRDGSFADIWNCFGYPGLHQLLELCNYTIYQVFGTNGLAWFLIFSMAHAFTGLMVFRLLQELTLALKIKEGQMIAMVASILFVFSPYQAEVLIWKVCLHYILATLFIVLSLRSFTRYYYASKRTDFIGTIIYFLVALFFLEVALIMPLLIVSLWLLFRRGHVGFQNLRPILLTVLLQILIIVGYFFLNRAMTGAWIGHYGADRHLNSSMSVILPHAWMYFTKYLTFAHFFPFGTKEAIYKFLAQPYVYYSLSALSILGFGFLCTRLKRLSGMRILTLASFAMFFIALAPIVNLFFVKVLLFENDRYGYLACIFFYLFITLMVFSLPKIIRILVLVILFVATAFTLFTNIKYASLASKVSTGLLEDFRWYDKEEVVILTIPENVGGLLMFRDYTKKGISFNESLELLQGQKFEGKLSLLTQHNRMLPGDHFGVKIISASEIDVMMAQGGMWWWQNGMGASNFETDDFKVELNGWFYKLHIKDPSIDRTYIYPTAFGWKEVDFASPQ